MLIVLLFTALVVALGLSLIATPVVIRLASARSLFDSPDGERRVHEDPVPRLGGVAVYLCALVSAIALFAFGQSVFGVTLRIDWDDFRFLASIVSGSAILFVVGVVDDIRGLRPFSKFIAQFAAAGLVVYAGMSIDSITLGYGQGVSTGFLAVPLLFVWIVGVTNAYNFIDGLNGLAGGIAVTALATIAITGLYLGNIVALVPIFALAGGVLGFLKYNFPKARIFLGDSGSLSVGFLLAVLSVRAAQTAGGSTIAVIPLLALFLPLLDTLLALLRRWLRNAPVTGADARHIHHRLLALGLTPQRTTVILLGLAAFFGGLGLVVALTRPFVATSLAVVAISLVTILVIYGTNLLSYHEFTVAGEVLLAAPSRFRRSISDQIVAYDARTRIENAMTEEEIASVLAATAMRFGFLHIAMISSDKPGDGYIADPDEWVWKMEYPLRLPRIEGSPRRALAIWCRAEMNMRPYGAERAARIIAPALEQRITNGPPVQATASRRFDGRLTPPAGQLAVSAFHGGGAGGNSLKRR